jgi:hypothetical protein
LVVIVSILFKPTIMNQRIPYIFILLFGIVLWHVNLFSQTQKKVVIISNKVGTYIDSAEKVNYYLFPEYTPNEFKTARFLERDDGNYEVVIYKSNKEKDLIQLSDKKYKEIQKQINKKEVRYNEIDTSYVYSIFLIDETILKGIFKEISTDSVVIETSYLGIHSLSKSKILKIEKMMSIKDSQSRRWFDNPHESRHFFAPTARNLKKGEGYFQDVYIIFGFVNYGITDNILIGGGTSIIPGIGLENQVFFLNPKLSFQVKENLYLGGGVFYGNFPNNEYDEVTNREQHSRQGAFIAYGLGTLGNRENNITLGIGYLNFKEASINKPIVMLGGMYRISRRAALVTENWFSIINYEYEKDAVEWEDINWEEYAYLEIFDDLNGRHENLIMEYPFEENTRTIKKENVPAGITMYGVRFFSEKMCVDVGFFNILGKFEDMDELKFYFPGIPYLDFVVKF